MSSTIGRSVIELPAGLTGDIPGAEDEALVEAARRELIEETGYAAQHWQQLATGCSSPGLTDEAIALFLARGLEMHAAGGGDHSEDIIIHEIAVSEMAEWLSRTVATAVLKLFAGLYAAEQHLRRQQEG